MPHAGKFKVKKNFMSKCMRTTKREGKKPDQSLAQCLSMWREKHRGKDAADESLAYKDPHPNYVKDHGNCPICGEHYEMTCKCRLGNKICPNKHGWHTCPIHKKVFIGDSHRLGVLRAGSKCVCPIEEDNSLSPEKDAFQNYYDQEDGGDVALPKDLKSRKDLKNRKQKDASVIDRVAGNLEKTMEQAEKSDKPTVFLGGSCKDNKWREDLKDEFKDKLFFIDPYDPDWDPEENIYKELEAIVNADHSIFYDSGEGSDKEMEFLDNTDRDYEEFDDLEDLKGYLNRLAEPVTKKACVSEMLRRVARLLESHEKYGFLGIKVPDNIANKIKAVGKEIPDNELYLDTEGYGSSSKTGRENDTHITLVFGLRFSDPDILKEDFKGVEPFTVTLNKTSLFTENPKCDVLKVGVNSPALQDLHEKLREKYHPSKEKSSYIPHCTISYMKKGYAEKYIDKDFSEYTFKVNEVFFSYESKKTTIKLGR
jgi:2'-5' RNA ligase